jgi:hypothetical protein
MLVSWCVGDRCDMTGSDENLGRSRKPGAEDQGQVEYSVVGRSGGRVTPCVVCTMHKEMRSAYFLVEPQNQGRRFLGLGLKTKLVRVCRLRYKTDERRIA